MQMAEQTKPADLTEQPEQVPLSNFYKVLD